MLTITCHDRNSSLFGNRSNLFTWTRGNLSPFQKCGLNELTTYDRVQVNASGEELKLILAWWPDLLPRITPMMTSHSITFFGETALFIAFNFPYGQFENV